ncbi:MAG: uracil-DNA glycosylase [Endomicrobia bacterium]|nr:uracil-DNA glycosylase [Endomicrobiia bacterium]MCL2507507.1 uracil-DNA glycosylase [Endomicrobiia bacterium]
MKQSEYLDILKLAKRTLEEYTNWDEDEMRKISVSETAKKEDIVKPAIISEKQKSPKDVLQSLREKTSKCRKCPLGASRLNCVFGEGAPNAELMFVGEGPGFDEDHEGRPFIGRAGQQLTKIIDAMSDEYAKIGGTSFKREDVYIANIVKCHPMKDPSNPEQRKNDRKPTPEEMEACKPYLDKQIEIVQPKIIVTLGDSSTKGLLKTEESISLVRGKFREYNGIKVMPTYHPAALLHNPGLKKDVWDDMKKVLNYMKTGVI